MRSVVVGLSLVVALVAASCTTPSPSPRQVQVVAGDSFTCSLNESGAVSCWGDNSLGQLGNGASEGTNDPNPVPTKVTPLDAGYVHSRAVTAAGTSACWGRNFFGESGNPATSGATSPLPTPAIVAGT